MSAQDSAIHDRRHRLALGHCTLNRPAAATKVVQVVTAAPSTLVGAPNSAARAYAVPAPGRGRPHQKFYAALTTPGNAAGQDGVRRRGSTVQTLAKRWGAPGSCARDHKKQQRLMAARVCARSVRRRPRKSS